MKFKMEEINERFKYLKNKKMINTHKSKFNNIIIFDERLNFVNKEKNYKINLYFIVLIY